MSDWKFALVSRRANVAIEDAAHKGDSLMQSWIEWQKEIVALLQGDFREILDHVWLDDVNWPAWRIMYTEGRSPRAAIDRALERDL